MRQSTQSRLKKTQEASSSSGSSSPPVAARDAIVTGAEVKKPVDNATSFTSEQEVFNKHRRALAQSVPDSQSYLLDGLLFYRVSYRSTHCWYCDAFTCCCQVSHVANDRSNDDHLLLLLQYQNENRKAEIEHDREINEVLMRTQGLRIAHRGSSIDSFSTRFARRKKVQLELSLKREEVERLKQSNRKLEELNEASCLTSSSSAFQSEDKANEKYSIDKLTRLQRAMSGINGGGVTKSKGTGHRIVGSTKTSSSSHALSGQGSSTSRLMILSSRRILSSSGDSRADDSPPRRAGFTLNAATDLNEDDDDGSLAYRKLFSETNVRHAQDLLLLAQIERGVLPEQFVKQSLSSDDPDHVSVVLSKYGIGDMRGLCLGIWYVLMLHTDCIFTYTTLHLLYILSICVSICMSGCLSIAVSSR